MLPETHPSLSDPPRPPAVCGEGERSVDGCCRGGSGSYCQTTGGKPQRGPGKRADTLLQDTGRHDGEKWLEAPSVQHEEETGQELRCTHAQNLGCAFIIHFFMIFYFIYAVYNVSYQTDNQKTISIIIVILIKDKIQNWWAGIQLREDQSITESYYGLVVL